MSAQRLSRIQKIILRSALENNGHLPNNHVLYEAAWGKDRVWKRMHPWYDARGNPTANFKHNWIDVTYIASLSRSKKGLAQKGLLVRDGWGRGFLTEAGMRAAKALTLSFIEDNDKNQDNAGSATPRTARPAGKIQDRRRP